MTEVRQANKKKINWSENQLRCTKSKKLILETNWQLFPSMWLWGWNLISLKWDVKFTHKSPKSIFWFSTLAKVQQTLYPKTAQDVKAVWNVLLRYWSALLWPYGENLWFFCSVAPWVAIDMYGKLILLHQSLLGTVAYKERIYGDITCFLIARTLNISASAMRNAVAFLWWCLHVTFNNRKTLRQEKSLFTFNVWP